MRTNQSKALLCMNFAYSASHDENRDRIHSDAVPKAFDYPLTGINGVTDAVDALVRCAEVCLAAKYRVMKQAGTTADPNVCFPDQLLDKLPVDPAPGNAAIFERDD